MKYQVIQVFNRAIGHLEELLHALGHLADGEIEDIHSVHKHFKISADITILSLSLNTGVGGDRIAHTGMNLEGLLAAAIGIEGES